MLKDGFARPIFGIAADPPAAALFAVIREVETHG
jgi:hypothetical protein